jgi:hypothetical protein
MGIEANGAWHGVHESICSVELGSNMARNAKTVGLQGRGSYSFGDSVYREGKLAFRQQKC